MITNAPRFIGRAFSPYSRKAKSKRQAAFDLLGVALRENGSKPGGVALREDGGQELRE